jgi:hypothetical protein
MKDSFHVEMETSVPGFPMNDVAILLGEFNANNLMDVMRYKS